MRTTARRRRRKARKTSTSPTIMATTTSTRSYASDEDEDDDDDAARVGDDTSSWGFDAGGLSWHGGEPSLALPGEWKAGDVIGLAIDAEAGTIWCGANGAWVKAFDGLTAAELEGVYPALSLRNAAVEVNFGAAPFKFDAPAEGFGPLSTTLTAKALEKLEEAVDADAPVAVEWDLADCEDRGFTLDGTIDEPVRSSSRRARSRSSRRIW